MFIENTRPNSVQVGSMIFHGGLTKVDKKSFEAMLKQKRVKKPFEEMVALGLFNVIGGEPKLTKAMVEKTFDLKLLEEYLTYPSATGVIKGAIKKQMELLELPAED